MTSKTGQWGVTIAALVAVFAVGCDGESDAPPACTNQQCIEQNGGEPAICNASSTCVALKSVDCTEVHGDVSNDDVIVIGEMVPLTGEFAPSSVAQHEGAILGIEEAQGAGRPLAMLSCHDLDDSDRVAVHLIETVGVPAIIGPAFSGVTVKTAQAHAIPAGVMLVSPTATSPTITGLADDGLVWRTISSDALQAVPLADLVSQLETRIRADLGLAPTEPVRLAMTVKQDAYGLGLADSVTPLIMLNGQPLTGDNAMNVLRSEYADPEEDPNVDYAPIVADVVAFAPHIVMALGTSEGVTRIMTGVEQDWPMMDPPPFYLFPDGGASVSDLDTAIGTDDALRLRILGTAPGRRGEKFAPFESRYVARFGGPPEIFAENGYDAAYVVAYAAAAASETTGKGIAAGIARLLQGTAVTVGPDGAGAGFGELAAGSSIDLDGISSTLGFDEAGDLEMDIDIWCLGRGPADELVLNSSGQYYDAAAGTLQGMIACQ
jgi:branched-chain amino acid transport system substrate-binding protein